MKKISYTTQLLVLLFWIPIVVALFRYIPDARVASVFAGAGFIVIPSIFLLLELLSACHRSALIIGVMLQFLIFFAIPIFSLRIYFWSTPFNQIQIFGVSPEALHSYSNISYFLIVMVLAVTIALQWRNKKSQPKG